MIQVITNTRCDYSWQQYNIFIYELYMDNNNIHNIIVIILVALIVWQLYTYIVSNSKEHFTQKILSSCPKSKNCDAVWPTYHNVGYNGCNNVLWHYQSPRMILKDYSLSCKQEKSVPSGLMSELTESYNPNLIVGAIGDNILGSDANVNKYESPITSGTIVPPSGCDCSTAIERNAISGN